MQLQTLAGGDPSVPLVNRFGWSPFLQASCSGTPMVSFLITYKHNGAKT